jgi:hypothetical protein
VSGAGPSATRGPAGDHTLCAEVNVLSVYARHTGLQIRQLLPPTCGMRYRYLLGVKWSQVQILSARPRKGPLTCLYGIPGDSTVDSTTSVEIS